jgi:hypothetical protein
MRKRLVIGAVAALLFGVGAHIISQPKQGTVEWHKDQYLRAQKKLERRTILDCLERFYVRVRKPQNYTWRTVSGDELQRHQAALTKLGFLEKKRVEVKNHLAGHLHSILAEGRQVIPEEREPFTQLAVPPAITIPIEGVELVAPGQDIPLWIRLIKEADANVPPDPRPKRSLKLTAPETVPQPAGLDEIFQEPRGY